MKDDRMLRSQDTVVNAITALTLLLQLKENELCDAKDTIHLLQEDLRISELNKLKLAELEAKQADLLHRIQQLVEENRKLRGP